MEELRQACDRCHGKKLRCPKQPGCHVCVRCAKADVPCVYSPPTRPVRNGSAGDRGQTQQQDTAGFDWNSFLDLDQISANGGFTSDTQHQNPALVTPPLSDNSNKNPGATEMGDLTRLLNCLDGLQVGTTSASTQFHVSIQRLKDPLETSDTKLDLQMVLESLLQYGQELIQLYPKTLKRANPCTNNSNQIDRCTIPDCVHKLRRSLRPRPSPVLDCSLLNVLIACHLRLIDILEYMIDHSRVCSDLFSHLPADTQPNFDIPEIRIGSFVAPKGSAASLVTTMLVELQSSLQVRCQEMSDLITSIGGEPSLESRVLMMQCDMLEKRATDVLADMRQLREQLFSSGIIR